MTRTPTTLMLLFAVLGGCSREPVEVVTFEPCPISVTYGTNITLSPSQPADTNLGIRLIGVSPDGTVTLEQSPSGQRESIQPEACMFTNFFGIALNLRESSPSNGSARFTLLWSEWE